MPSTSPAQRKFMAAAAHNPKFAAAAKIPQSVAQEFNQADHQQDARQQLAKALAGRKG